MKHMFFLLLLPFATWAAIPPKMALEQGGIQIELVEKHDVLPIHSVNGNSHVAIKNPDDTGLKLTNLTDERVQILFTFNNINPMTGRKGIMQDSGFVLKPRQTLVIEQGRLSKRKKDKPQQLFATQQEGSFHIAVFKERSDYPLILPNMTPPPFKEENFVTSNGVRRWVPPVNYPFRRNQQLPNYSFYITYGR